MGRISFQGWAGANSHMACAAVYPDWQAVPCPSFEGAIEAVHGGRADLAMIPIENSVAGRVADIHHLLPDSGLHIIAEHFQPVRHQLLAPHGTRIDQIERVHSHVHALGQCRGLIRRLGVEPVISADTAGAAEKVAEWGRAEDGAIASSLAARIYDLEILAEDVEDASHNTTRFLVMAPRAERPDAGCGRAITSFLFEVRSVPAALYKALGGFATNSVNICKLESYMLGGRFDQTQFYADVEGHVETTPLIHALEELRFFTKHFQLMGVYPASPFRRQPSQQAEPRPTETGN